jgi:hypothetical protein
MDGARRATGRAGGPTGATEGEAAGTDVIAT